MDKNPPTLNPAPFFLFGVVTSIAMGRPTRVGYLSDLTNLALKRCIRDVYKRQESNPRRQRSSATPCPIRHDRSKLNIQVLISVWFNYSYILKIAIHVSLCITIITIPIERNKNLFLMLWYDSFPLMMIVLRIFQWYCHW